MNINVTFEQDNMELKPKFEEFVKAGTTESCTVFYPNVSDEGIISWTNNGDLPNPKPVNIKGKDGIDGKDGLDGKDGYAPQKGIDYFDGEPGKDGQDGKPGADGYTPVKGKDYWTEADKAEIVADVIAALPVYNGEVV